MFVTFEGPEGAGKSTILALVAEKLRAQGRQVVTTREPGDGPLGPPIRQLILHGEAMDARTELFLFLADRAQHTESLIRPALEAGKTVLCDRYSDSTVVYQGVARGLDRALLRELNEFATGGLKPDLTLLFDLDPEVGLARVQGKDRLDAEPLEFHKKVRQGFLELAREEPARWRIVDASKSKEEVFADVFGAMSFE
ncbi:MAG: dTMP kinase [Fimbriimonadaceae bacterium]|nr:dTMP kinase [Fimbriimonadaceae bacterium]